MDIVKNAPQLIVYKKKRVHKRNPRPSENMGKESLTKSKKTFSKYDYIYYLKNPENILVIKKLRSQIEQLFGCAESHSLILNRSYFHCPLAACKEIHPNDVGGNLASFIKHLRMKHGDTNTANEILKRWDLVKRGQDVLEEGFNDNSVLYFPPTNHKAYCDISIVDDMIKSGDKEKAKDILDSRVKNIVVSDWTIKL